MRGLGRRDAPSVPLGPGETLLAWGRAGDGTVVAGTRDAVYVGDRRLPWERVEAADWDADTETFRLSEVGTWGEARVEHQLTMAQPRRLLELVRERVTASVVLQRHVAVDGRRGLRVIARRAPHGDRDLTWVYEFDEGVDPDDPAVREVAREALRVAREEVGLA